MILIYLICTNAIIWYIYHSDLDNLADTDMIIYSNIRETIWHLRNSECFAQVSKWFVALSPEIDSECWTFFHLRSSHGDEQFLSHNQWWSKSTLCVTIPASFCLCNCGWWVPPNWRYHPSHVLQLGKHTCPWFMLYGYWRLLVLLT